MSQKYLSAHGAAAYLGLSYEGLRRMRRERRGPPYSRRGRRVYYDPVDIDHWIDAGKVKHLSGR